MTQHPYDYIHDYAYNSSLDRAKLRVQLPLRVEDYKGKLCIANKDINYCRHSIKKMEIPQKMKNRMTICSSNLSSGYSSKRGWDLTEISALSNSFQDYS